MGVNRSRETSQGLIADCDIEVLAGTAWITKSNCQSDFILREGQRMELRGRGWAVEGLRAGGELRYRTHRRRK